MWLIKLITLYSPILISTIYSVPVFHTVNEYDLFGNKCPLPTLKSQSCPQLCVSSLDLCPTSLKPSTCPTNQVYCGDGNCHENCAGIFNPCACTTSLTQSDTFLPCLKGMKVDLIQFNVTLKRSQLTVACTGALNFENEKNIFDWNESIQQQGVDRYYENCPPTLPLTFTYREPLWISVFSILAAQILLWVGWLCYKSLKEHKIQNYLIYKNDSSNSTTTTDLSPSDELKLKSKQVEFIIQTYQFSIFGSVVYCYTCLISLGWLIFLAAVVADYYGKLTGLEYGMFLQNYDQSSLSFILIWTSTCVWFVTMNCYKYYLPNFFKLQAASQNSNYVRVTEQLPKVLSINTEDLSHLDKLDKAADRFLHFMKLDTNVVNLKLQRLKNEVFFTYKSVRYTFLDNQFQILQISLPTTPHSLLKLKAGLSSSEVGERQLQIGPNFIAVDIPPFYLQFLLEFTTPFYQYQLLIMWLFFYFAYYEIGLVDTALILISALIKVILKYKSLKRVKKMAEVTSKVQVLRDGGWIELSSEQLVPGDVFELEPNMIVPCDTIVIEGDVVVDEASLTGEPLPLRKFKLDDSSAATTSSPFDPYKAHKLNVVYDGTKILQTTSTSNSALGLVWKIGPNTDRGKLIYNILFPTSTTFNFDRQLKVVVLILAGWGLLIFALAMWLMGKGGTSAWFYAMFGFAQVLSPLLPAALVVGQSVAASRLKKLQIYCVDLTRIVIAGKVKLFAFDKTGTLTTTNLQFSRCYPTESWHLNDGVEFNQLDPTFQMGLATCHSITLVNNQFVGNPVDIELFKATNFSKKTADSIHFLDTIYNDTKSYNVVLRFEFEHVNQSMAVVIQDSTSLEFHMFIKGSYEKIKSLVNPKSIPNDYDTKTERLAKLGNYVLALAHNKLLFKDVQEIKRKSRKELEANANLLGLITFKNPLKEDTNQAITELRGGDVRTVMVTGDNAYTGIQVAKQANLTYINTVFLLAELECNELAWKLVGDGDKTTEAKYTTEQVLNSTTASQINLNDYNELELALTGKAFNYLIETNLETLTRLLPHIRVFARMTPIDKVTCIQHLSNLGTTAMCGDGGNDCGALRVAQVGLALSQSEASLTAPFVTPPNQPLTVCNQLLSQGRAALATSLASYKFLIMYGQTMAMLKLPSFYFAISLSQNLWILVDAAVTVGLAYAITQSKPNPKLNKFRPTASLLGLETLSSTLGLLIIHYTFAIGAYAMLYNQSFFRCNEFDGNTVDVSKWWLLGDNYEGSLLGILCLFQFVNVAFVFNFGFRYRKPWYQNYWLLSIWLGFIILCSYVTVADPNLVGCAFRINCGDNEVLQEGGYSKVNANIMKYNLPQGHNVFPVLFRVKLLALCYAMCISAILWERCVVLNTWIRQKISRRWLNKRKLKV